MGRKYLGKVQAKLYMDLIGVGVSTVLKGPESAVGSHRLPDDAANDGKPQNLRALVP